MDKAKQSLSKAQQHQAKYADRHRRFVHYAVGDQVMLSTEYLKLAERNLRSSAAADGTSGTGTGGVLQQTAKLMPKFIGPFTIEQCMSDTTYRLSLPANMKIHPVFHVSKLKPYIDGVTSFPSRPPPASLTRPPPDLTDSGEEVWEVERVVDQRVVRRGGTSRLEYLVLWKGYPDHEKTWEPAHHLKDAQEKIRQFKQSTQRSTRGKTAL
jgi:hypothetical protein